MRALALAAGVAASACGSGASGGFEDLMDIGVCDPDLTTFSLEIDNPYLPLRVGGQSVLEGEEAGRLLVLRITVLDETEVVAGVETRVVEEHEAADGRVVETSRNFFAQADDGTVCYFGEQVDMFGPDGGITSHAGSWRAGEDGNSPGIFMPASLEVGQAFQQEVAPGVAEDQSEVIALGAVTEVPAGTFTETATLLDRNPLDGSQDVKVYAEDIGLIVDATAGLTSFQEG